MESWLEDVEGGERAGAAARLEEAARTRVLSAGRGGSSAWRKGAVWRAAERPRGGHVLFPADWGLRSMWEEPAAVLNSAQRHQWDGVLRVFSTQRPFKSGPSEREKEWSAEGSPQEGVGFVPHMVGEAIR